MKDKPNEWISISDLMAGVMAVVMLMLVLSVLQNKVADVKREQEKNSGQAAAQQKLNAMMHSMQQEMVDQGVRSRMAAISEQVLNTLEKRLRNEKSRRGI